MSKTAKRVLFFAGIFFMIIVLCIVILVRGAVMYVKSCAHISVYTNVTAHVGDTISIDDLAMITNCDEKKINGIIGGGGEISEDGQSITITSGTGTCEISVFATNDHAPEWTEKTVTVTILEEDNK